MKLAILITCPEPYISAEFMMNLIALLSSSEMNSLSHFGITSHMVIFNREKPIEHARNQLCKMALEAEADYLIFLDPDLIYPRGFIHQLLRPELDIIGPLYFKNAPPYAPIPVYRKTEDRQLLVPVMNYEKEIIEVDATGCGGLLIKADVLRNHIDYPWFDTDIYKPTDERTVSEDVVFCDKAQQVGYNIHVDTRIICGRIGQAVYGESHWMAYRKNTEEYIQVSLVDAIAKSAKNNP